MLQVMLSMLNKTGMPQMKRYVWFSTFAGLLLACIIGAGFVAAFYIARDQAMNAKDKAVFSGVFSGVAGIFLAILAVQFLRFKDVELSYKRKLKEGFKRVKDEQAARAATRAEAGEPAEETTVADALTHKAVWADSGLKATAWSIMTLCFTAVVREGIETFVFLASVGSNTDGPAAIAIGCITGLILGVIFGVVVLMAGRCVRDFRIFLATTTIFILFIAAGLIAMSAAAFKTVALIESGNIDNDFVISRPVYDIYKATGDGHQECGFFAVMRAIVGYTHNPPAIWWIAYMLFWGGICALLGYRYYHGTLFSKTGPIAAFTFGGDDEDEDDEEDMAARPKAVSTGSGSSIKSELVVATGMPPMHFAPGFAYPPMGYPSGGSAPPIYPAAMPQQQFVGFPQPPMPPQIVSPQPVAVQGNSFGAGVFQQ